MEADEVVLMFARWPAAGEVKTRLAAAIGSSLAARFYQAFVDDLVQTMATDQHRLVLAVTPASRIPDFDRRYGLPVWPQAEGDLGFRMGEAFRQAFHRGHKFAVLIGSDVPQMAYARVRAALVALRSVDVVLGATEDGGYDLIGLHRPIDVFSGMTWSHPQVLEETLKRCQGLRYLVLQPDFDIDTVTDLRRLATIPHLLGEHTRMVLEDWLVHLSAD